MSDEDDDYMSADFLEKCLPKDVKPGLQSRNQKREHELYVQKEKRRDEAQREKHVKKRWETENNQIRVFVFDRIIIADPKV